MRIKYSIAFSIIFVGIMWLTKVWEYTDHLDLYYLGIFPRELKGLVGVLFSPFIHKDWDHLISNSIPCFILLNGLFYFYNKISFVTLLCLYISTGLITWLIGRDAYHIGASGLVYALAMFIFCSGILRRSVPLMALSLVVVFLYGSIIWGLFPFFDANISYEGHIAGFLSGIIVAIIFRNKGPQREKYEWEEEEEDISVEL